MEDSQETQEKSATQTEDSQDSQEDTQDVIVSKWTWGSWLVATAMLESWRQKRKMTH